MKKAALRVLAAETLEDFLGWLIRNSAVPSGDVRPNQLVRDADTPPSRWPEAAHSDGGMAERLAALMEGDHP